MQNAQREHSAILSTCIMLPFVFKTFVLSFFEWPLKAGFNIQLSIEAHDLNFGAGLLIKDNH